MNTEITLEYLREFRRFDDETALITCYSGIGASRKTETVICRCVPGDFEAGRRYRFYGYWKDHPRYGRQFSADSFVEDMPTTREAIIFYLSKLPGIGASTAAKIADKYGEATLQTIAGDCEILVREVRGMHPDEAEIIARKISEEIEVNKTIVELGALFAGCGFRRSLPKEVMARWGSRSMAIIRRNPYLLLRFTGCGFTNVDKFALNNGYNPRSLKRQAYGLMYSMSQDSDVWFDVGYVSSRLQKMVGAASDVGGTCKLLRRCGELFPRSEYGIIYNEASNRIAPSLDAAIESTIADLIVQRLNAESQWPKIEQGTLSDSQYAAIMVATHSPIGCFTGGPGTGKTYTVARLISAIIEAGGSIACVAPTGKAAVRSGEVLKEIGIEIPTMTIHSFLRPKNGSLKEFECDRDNPVSEQYIIVDESSMIDAGLMASLLSGTVNSHILFVGDTGQLLPVGKGCPFRDMMNTGGIIPTGYLTETRRNSGRIVEVCTAIRRREPIIPAVQMAPETGDNLICVQANDYASTILRIIRDIQVEGFDPIRDVQTIVSLNDKSPCSRSVLNDALKLALNPNTEPTGKYRVGDPILCIKNGLYPTPAGSIIDRTPVSNGEIGYCTDITRSNDVIVTFSDRKVKIRATNNNFCLAYAVTCHKMQGSETPVAIVVIDESYGARMVCTNEWVYTAISRAKKRCYLVGSMGTIRAFCQHFGNVRVTRLSETIVHAIEYKETQGCSDSSASTSSTKKAPFEYEDRDGCWVQIVRRPLY